MGVLRPSLLALLLLVSTASRGHSMCTITVDLQADNSNCLSAQQLLASNSSQTSNCSSVCRTLTEALGNVRCNYTCSIAEEERIDGIRILLADGVHHLQACIPLIETQNVVFEAVNHDKATITCVSFPNYVPRNFDNIFVCNSRNITFRGIKFEKCGPVPSNVFVRVSSDIVFDSCTFSRNQGAPLQFRLSTRVTLTNTVFHNNNNTVEAQPDVNETQISELYNSITTSGGFTFFSSLNDVEFRIDNCTFMENSANKNDPNNSRPVLLKQNGHGGSILIRLYGTENTRGTISNSLFERNYAQVDGGAIYISVSESTMSSVITLRNNRYVDNTVTQASGGAVSINSFLFTFNNTFIVEDSIFTGNRGNAGGAFSLALYDSNLNSSQFPDSVVFTRCVFEDNFAENEGTAVGLFSLVHVDQIGFPVSFEDCTFRNNTSLEEAQDTSAVAAFRFPIVFSGYNNFTGNTGGGISLLNTRMQASGSLLFENNVAVFGGGLSMDDRCVLEISANTNITFMNNTATESGGAIYVEFPPIRFVVDIFNRLCFLQYNDNGADVEPQNWKNVEILFIRNTARLSGAAIFASDMQQCGWLGNEFTSNTSLIFSRPENISEEDYPFKYIDNMLLPEGFNVSRLENRNLATSPSKIEYNIPEYEFVQPGETLQINLFATDQVNNIREAVWSLEAPSSPANLDALSTNVDTYPYNIPSIQDLLDSTASIDIDLLNSNNNFTAIFDLKFSLLRTLGSVSTLTLRVNGCHPGYGLNKDKVCDCNIDNNANILRCDDNNRYLYLREGVWGNYVDNRQLITARVQPGYVECERQGRLQGCLFKFDNINQQCREGRQGRLCGECAANYSVTLDLQECQSTPCILGLPFFLLLCISVVALCLLFLIFDFKLPNELKAFFFYAQVIGLVYRPYQVVQSADNDVTKGLSIFLNLLGFSVPIPFCLWEDLQAHHVALLGYISPILAFVTIIGYVIAAQFIGALGTHSALNGLTFISLFVYKYVADTALIFISCLIDENLGYVFQYDGSVDCISFDFGFFSLIGFFLEVFFVIPFPFVVGYICVKRPLMFQHYADVLTRGLRTKHRWWGGWDIMRRLPFVFLASFLVYARPSFILFLMSLMALGVLLIHVFTKPFEKMHINIIEAAILLNLLMVTAAFLDPSNSPVPFAFSTILVILPYVFAAGYTIFIIVRKIWWRIKNPPVNSKIPVKGEHASSVTKSEVTGSELSANPLDTGSTIGNSDSQSSSAATKTTGIDKPSSLSADSASHPPIKKVTLDEDYSALREPLLDEL